MPLYHKLVDYTEIYENLPETPIIINDLSTNTQEDREYIDDLIMTRCSTDMLSILPSCRCGKTKGEYIIGTICEYCNTPVKSKIEQDIHPLVWFRRPMGVAPLISIAVLNMLKNKFKVTGYDIIDWLIDTTYVSSKKIPPVLNAITDAGIQRGYNFFVNNFDNIMEILFSMKIFRVKGNKPDELYELIKRDRHLVFSDYIPLPNKTLFIVEDTSTGRYVDATIVDARDAINTITSIDKKFANSSSRVRENRTAKALLRLAKFYSNFAAQKISPKKGLIRKHVIATRSHFCSRAVITSITKPHKYDEIEMPWSIGLTLFRVHLLSKLMRIGFSYNGALGLLIEHVNKYHPLLDKLLDELIEEAPNKRIPITHQRNPSLHQGSLQLMYISKFKKNPEDVTVGTPITNVKAFNADFDGDEMNNMLIIDGKMEELLKPLSPHFTIFGMESPGKFSGNIELPKPVVANISSWLKDG